MSDTLQPLEAFFKERLRSGGHNDKFPAVALSRHLMPDLSKGSISSISSWTNEPMSGNRFINIVQSLAMKAGLPKEEASKLSYNSLRKFLPTLGEVLDFDDSEMQSLSN